MFKHSGWLVAGALVCLAMAGSALSGPTTPSQYDGCVYTSAGITLSDGQPGVVQCDSTGHVLVAATATLTNPTIGAPVPATANYIGGNVGGILQGVTLENTSGAIMAMDVKCVVGCGGNTNGQATMANSAPVVIASNQSNVPVSQATAASLNATVTQGPSGALGSGWAIKGDELADTTGTFTNATQTTSVTATGLDGYDTALITINGTFGTATAVFEGSDDSGTTWFPIQAARSDGTASELGYTTLTNTTRAWISPINGFDSVRVRSTAVASGTVTVRISALSQTSAAAASNSLSGYGAGVDTGNGVTSANSLRVTLSSDSTGQVKLATGANTIGALTANQSINLVQANGTTLDTNSGVKSAGTMRVVLATDQPALTNKLLVTPDSVALPANQSVNVSQINAVTPLMGNGVSGTGAQRVTIASDSTGQIALAAGAATIGALTANQSVNIAQMNGVATTMNAGVVGTGVQRVTLASDQTTLTNTIGNVGEVPVTSGGLSISTLTLANSTNATNVKASAGQLYSITGFNMSSATPVWVSLYNNAGTPTCGTSIVYQAMIPGSTTGAGFVLNVPPGIAFSTGIAFCATTGIAGTGAVAASTYVVNFGFK